MRKTFTYLFISVLAGVLLLGGCKTKQNATVKNAKEESQSNVTNEKSISIDKKDGYKPACEHHTVEIKEPTHKEYYYRAYQELDGMLTGETEPDFERAVFISENPYHNNKYSYNQFQESIDWHLLFINTLIVANDKSDSMEFNAKVNSNGRFNMDEIRYPPKEKKELYQKALANWAIFTYLTDTTALFPFYNLPYTYSTQDPFGIKDWTNSQVIGLLSSKEQKGNCYSMTALYKILADRLNSDATLCTAPQHIYIQHRDPKGHYYNVELATAGHPTDGMIQVLTHTTSDAIKSGIALRNYDEKQSIGLCLINLAKSYEHTFETKDDEFMLRCAELVLKYDGLNLNALLLKQQILDVRVSNYAIANNIKDINTLKRDSTISNTMIELEKHTVNLYLLGYRQMPLDMQEMVLTGINKNIEKTKNPSPFTTIKPKDPRDAEYVTLSGGIFQEVFETKIEEAFGNFTYNTNSKTITNLNTQNPSINNQLIDPVAFAYDFGARIYDARLGRWLSTDPLQAKYPMMSPYVGIGNNPIVFIDPDGRKIIDANGNEVKVTITKTEEGTVKAISYEFQDNTSEEVKKHFNDNAGVLFSELGNTKTGTEQIEKAMTSKYKEKFELYEGENTDDNRVNDGRNDGTNLGWTSYYVITDKETGEKKLNENAPITHIVYKGSITKVMETVPDLMPNSLREYIASTIGHEIEHATEKNIKDKEYNWNNPNAPDKRDTEAEPNKINEKIIEEYDEKKK